MSGGRQSYKQRGLIPRVLSQLFTELRAMEGYEYKVGKQRYSHFAHASSSMPFTGAMVLGYRDDKQT